MNQIDQTYRTNPGPIDRRPLLIARRGHTLEEQLHLATDTGIMIVICICVIKGQNSTWCVCNIHLDPIIYTK